MEGRHRLSAVLIKNALVWDGIHDDAYPGEVLVEGQRIKAVASKGQQIAAERAPRVIDAQGQFLMPGMVEGHSHLSFIDVMRPRDLGEIPVEEHLLLTCANATLLLNHGFTSCYSAASSKMRLDVVVRGEIEAGRLAGPRYRAAGPEITTTGGLGDECRWNISGEGFGLVADGVDEIRKAVRLCIREGANNVKLNISGDHYLLYAGAEAVSMSECEVAAAVEVAHEWGRRVSAHARADASVKRAVRNHVDVIYHCEYADDEAIDMLAAARDRVFIGPAFGLIYNSAYEYEAVGLSPEFMATLEMERKIETMSEVYQKMRKAGIKVVVGGDYGFKITPQGQNARDVGHFVKFFGYTPAEALRCATAVGGELMGHRGELGVIREGALADLLLVKGNPLEDPTTLVGADRFAMIMKDGKLHKEPQLVGAPVS
jgi:imidazolonepropionase-like amidohydrolase